ncbi:MAG: chromosome segregation protein SMC [Gammaproteobacteria bacterium]|nr:chromosome segregation protein SMC [Gammaproteobacteria bacterium]
MRIARIKLAGFKSFVDPTTLHLPGNLTGVVGPNGCGKSNIIDALLWVMGEISAKQLRGESMADVIFSGSTTRKPVGQAAVELIFDNADGTVGGPYASFAEISIRRTVGRDGISSYFLNGTRCRRKDITDVFLGTGLGVRGGYSVIEQGMISQVIEAKPEELRNFLDEAAGISRYKERRRETETRIRHTHENLDRVNDIRQELDKQLTHLQRQARAAEKYQELKSEERRLEAETLVIRWREIDALRQVQRVALGVRATAVEAALAELRKIENDQAALRTAVSMAQGEFNDRQSAFYGKSADISRLELSLQHNEERRAALAQELARAHDAQAESTCLLSQDRERSAEVERSIAGLTPGFQASTDTEERHAEALKAAEQAAEAWQEAWDTFNQTFTETSRTEHAGQVRLEMLARGQVEAERRLAGLISDLARLDPDALQSALRQESEVLARKNGECEVLRTEHQRTRDAAALAREGLQAFARELSVRRTQWQEVRGRLASEQALQEAALGRDQRAVMNWLAENGFAQFRALAESLTIEPGWEPAAEAALAGRLTALCGPDLDVALLATALHCAPAASLTGVSQRAVNAAERRPNGPQLPRLIDKITSGFGLESLLAGVYAAPDLAGAQQCQGQLAAHESVVTRDGVWLGPNWVQVPGRRQHDDSVLVRERRLEELRRQAQLLTAGVAELEVEQRTAHSALQALETREGELSRLSNTRNGEATELRGGVQRQESALAQTLTRVQDLGRQRAELGTRAQAQAQELAGLHEEAAGLRRALTELDAQRVQLTARRRAVQVALEHTRTAWRQARDGRHAIALQLESLKSAQASAVLAIERNQRLSEELSRRSHTLTDEVAAARAPQTALRLALDVALGERMACEQALKQARTALEQLDQQARRDENARTAVDQQVTQRQRALEQSRLEERALAVRAQEQEERLLRAEQDLQAILASLEPAASEEIWREQLSALAGKIARLGPINLAAIDEFAQLSERKSYLDAQFADLTEALSTLAEAMRKIDKETRTRFRETFDQVNAGLQRLFPILFGGGHAYLELSGEDLLETGVTVMARPPGKRNSSIHLLSGGEKALAALAFVFALFELNPAPFCLLDEVDAPLDDANVVRLSEMLRQMSARVQFLFVSHNKITMEIAEQLIGVTMNEPGVSRLVSVNMDEAVQLAAIA